MIINIIEVIIYLIVQFSAFYLVYEAGRLKESLSLLEVLEKIKGDLPDEEKK